MDIEYQVDRLIAGLEVLKKYQTSMSLYSCGRVRRTLEVQEEAFGEISPADHKRLLELGWEAGGPYLWRF